MANQQNIKSKFLLSEFFSLSISGALQRANVYAKGAENQDKVDFKIKLKRYLNSMIEVYFSEVSEKDHLININELSRFTKEFPAVLKNGKLSFGVSQLILNLFLKYIWCLKLIPNPPHFPVDGAIQQSLNQTAAKLGIAEQTVVPWTKINDQETYLSVINFAKSLVNNPGLSYDSLAEFELSFYNS